MNDGEWIRSRAWMLHAVTGVDVEDCEQTLWVFLLNEVQRSKAYATAKRDLLRQQRDREHLPICESVAKPIEGFSLEMRELMDTVLTEDQRWIVTMRLANRRSWKSIAGTLKRTDHAVKKDYERCLRKLREYLEP